MADGPSSLRIYILSNSRSLYSTRRFFEAGSKRGHRMRVYPPADLSLSIGIRQPEILHHSGLLPEPDAVIPRVGHKSPQHTLSVIRHFEQLNCPVLNGSSPINRVRNKFAALQLLTRHKIPVPRSYLVNAEYDIDTAIQAIGGAPVIIKLPEGTQGKGVILAETERSARSVLEAFVFQGHSVIVQEFIQEARGSDLRLVILGGSLVASMRRTSSETDFRSNLHRGGLVENHSPTIETERMARLAARITGLTFAGVDIIESSRGPMVLEVNASPGFEGIEAATGVDIASACIAHIEKTCRPRRAIAQISE